MERLYGILSDAPHFQNVWLREIHDVVWLEVIVNVVYDIFDSTIKRIPAAQPSYRTSNLPHWASR